MEISSNILLINKKDKQIKFMLNLLNKILINSGIEEIKTLTEFKNIDRDIIILQSAILNDEMINNSLSYFSKIVCGWK